MFEGELHQRGLSNLDPCAPADSGPLTGRKQRTILVVDDHDSLLLILRDFLEKAGYHVATATNGRDATTWLSSQTPDLIVSDIMMPDVDGYQFFDCVKADERLATIPFIFLTALGNGSEVRNGKSLGCDDYLVKPFSPEDLLACIEGKLIQRERTLKATHKEHEAYQRRVINTLSHEFRTPLVAIHTGAELLLTNKDVEGLPRVRRLIEGIYRGGSRLQKLVADFMLLQQIVSGSCDRYHRSTVQNNYLSRLVESAIAEFRRLHQETEGSPLPEIRLELTAVENVQIRASATQLHDILQRLLGNAVKFGKNQPVEIVTSCEDGWCNIRIRDHGAGLAAEKLREACDTFSQINREHMEQQGAGLGLTVSAYLVKLNGGRLHLANADDGGLIATLSLPQVYQAESDSTDFE